MKRHQYGAGACARHSSVGKVHRGRKRRAHMNDGLPCQGACPGQGRSRSDMNLSGIWASQRQAPEPPTIGLRTPSNCQERPQPAAAVLSVAAESGPVIELRHHRHCRYKLTCRPSVDGNEEPLHRHRRSARAAIAASLATNPSSPRSETLRRSSAPARLLLGRRRSRSHPRGGGVQSRCPPQGLP